MSDDKTIEQIRDEAAKEYSKGMSFPFSLSNKHSFQAGFDKRGEIDAEEIEKLKRENEVMRNTLQAAYSTGQVPGDKTIHEIIRDGLELAGKTREGKE